METKRFNIKKTIYKEQTNTKGNNDGTNCQNGKQNKNFCFTKNKGED